MSTTIATFADGLMRAVVAAAPDLCRADLDRAVETIRLHAKAFLIPASDEARLYDDARDCVARRSLSDRTVLALLVTNIVADLSPSRS